MLPGCRWSFSSPSLNPDLGLPQTELMSRKSEQVLLPELASVMLKASNETRGTVASLAAWTKEVDAANAVEGALSSESASNI